MGLLYCDQLIYLGVASKLYQHNYGSQIIRYLDYLVYFAL